MRHCYVCARKFCEYCGTRNLGKDFCTRRCADVYFFGEGEDIDEQD